MQIRIMIAEDERLAREELVYLLEQEADVEVLPCATNGRELLQLVEEYEPDVVFLDIKMPELEGTRPRACWPPARNGLCSYFPLHMKTTLSKRSS